MKTLYLLFGLWLLAGAAGCRKEAGESPAIEREEKRATFPPPAWKEDETGRYPATMTAVVTLPDALQSHTSDRDQLAAFISDECRGVGLKDTIAGKLVYFIMIRGLADEQNKIVFKYYHGKTGYLYQTAPDLSFLIDAVYGTAQQPKQLQLIAVK